MNQALINALRKLHHTGRGGFEGLIAQLLEELTGRHFHLAQSGTQLGRDMSASGPNSNVIAVECKRYGEKTELNERELLGELVQVAKAIPDLDLWVLVTSRDIPSQLHESLRSVANDYDVVYLSISTGDGAPSSLEVLCTLAIDLVIEYLKDELCKTTIQQFLKKITTSAQFEQKIEQLRNKFTFSLIDYNSWRMEQNRFFSHCLCSETESRIEFGQTINLEEKGIKLIERKTAWTHLDEWFDGWRESRQPIAVLGEEGDGKTWSVASWLNYKLKSIDRFPPVLFLSSTSASTNDPENLLSEVIARRSHSLGEDQWKRRIKRWMQRNVNDTPLFFIVLDGINERRNFRWWEELILKLSGQQWVNQVAILITCRLSYWEQFFESFSYLQLATYRLSSYDDIELNEALAHENLQRSDIKEDLLNLICKPRYFDLMVKYRKQAAETGDVTVARLIYEDWRDRLKRKQNVPLLDDNLFKKFICDLVLKFQKGYKYITDQDVDNALPRFLEDKQQIFEELRTGGILQSGRRGYQVNEKLLIYGFGLLLVDQLEDASESLEKNLSEVLAEWLEPHAEMDIKAAICGFAALHALSLRDYPKQAKIALLQTWVYGHNPEQTVEGDFIAYLPIDPQCYIELAEIVWSDATENAWAQELLMQAFLRWRKSPNIISKLHPAFERWLGFFHICGIASLRGCSGERTERSKQEITDRLGAQPHAQQKFAFGNYTITAIEDAGLLRLGRVALAVISHLPRGIFLHVIATGCLAEAVMDIPSKYELFEWLFRSSPESIWQEVQKEFNQLLAVEKDCTQLTAHRLLSFEGSQEAYQLRQTLPQNLHAVDSPVEQSTQDPCYSWSQWTQAECEIYLSKDSISSKQVARNLKQHCINPDLLVPDDLGQSIESLTEEISVQKVRAIFQLDRDDYTLDDYEPVLCAYAPNAMVDLARRITRHVRERDNLSLHYLVFKLHEYSLTFRAEEQESIYCAWTRLIDAACRWSDEDRLTEAYLFQLVLKNRTAEDQLSHLIQRPENAIDLLAIGRNFLSISDWNIIRQHLTSVATTRTIQRVLCFLSSHPKFLPKDISHQLILPLLNHENSHIRASVLRILYFLKDLELIRAMVDGTWTWSMDQDKDWQENHWGSLLLCEYAIYLPYSELLKRIHPKYLGYAVQCRGVIEEEIKQYSESIQNVLLRLGTEVPDLPVEFPLLSIAASISENENILMIHRISSSDSSSSQKITFLSRDASWGGVVEGDSQDWREIMSPNSSEQRQQMQRKITNEVIKQQNEAGNAWFLQRLFPTALDQIIHNHPDLVDQWLNSVFADSSKGRRCLHLGYSFYEALCTILLKVAPDKGISLYWQLQEAKAKIYIRDEQSGIELLDYALFQASSSENVEFAWKKKLEACKTDDKLLEVAILAQHNNAHNWLWSVIKLGIQSTAAIEKSRAILLLAFTQERKAFNLLNSLLEDQPNTWIKDLLELSKQLWQKNDWAMHWFRCFLNSSDDETAWASFRLFLQCVDTRFWHWRQQIEVEVAESSSLKKRYEFLEDNLNTVKSRIRDNENPLREKLLGCKVLAGQVYPWM